MEEGITARTLKAYRESSGLGWVAIGKQIGVDQETLYGLRAQDRWPSLRTLKKIARFFQWGPAEMGQAVMHVPLHLSKKQKRRVKSAILENP